MSCKGGVYFIQLVCPLSVDAILWIQLLKFSKHFLKTFTEEQLSHIHVHKGRNWRCARIMALRSFK